MTFNEETLKRVVETAKAKAAGNARWINAIDKAVAGLTGGAWIVTELHDGLMITTESGETYHANGVCQCKAFEFNTPCRHRAAAQLVKRYHEAEAAEAASPAPVDYMDDEPEMWPMVRPEPAPVYAEGWSI